MLTLILSSVESLGTELKSKGNSVNKEINLMYNNSKVTSINQSIIRLQKSWRQKIYIKASIANLFDFQIVLLQILKEKKKLNIDFSLVTNNPDLEVYIDRNLMDKYTLICFPMPLNLLQKR
jgi:hypothetical protein